MSHIIPVAWQHETEPDLRRLRESDIVPLRLERAMGFDGTTYAIRQGSCCLNKKGEWEFEPIPSSRTDAFLKRCRWKDFNKAKWIRRLFHRCRMNRQYPGAKNGHVLYCSTCSQMWVKNCWGRWTKPQ